MRTYNEESKPWTTIDLLNESWNLNVGMVYDYPVSVDRVMETILSMDDTINSPELEARLELYRQLPVFDMEHTVRDVCFSYGLNAGECLEELGLAGDNEYHLVRSRGGGWGCTFCGTIFPSQRSGTDHIMHTHHIDQPNPGPPWMVCYPISEVIGRGSIRPFADDGEYLSSLTSFKGPSRSIEQNHPIIKKHINPRHWRDSRLRNLENNKTAYLNRARRLRSQRKGETFKIDDIVRRNHLPLLDILILYKALINEFLFMSFEEGGPHSARFGHWFNNELIPRFNTGLTHKDEIDYLRNQSNILLKKGYLTLEKEDGIDIPSAKNTFKELTGEKSVLARDMGLYMLQSPSVNMDDLVVSSPSKKKLQMAMDTWNRLTTLSKEQRTSMGKYGKGVLVLLSGPPGTGKTFTAYCMGGSLGLQVMEANLSDISNKYVGETEKNIKELFKTAEKKNAILLLDEVDALVSKRGNVRHASERLFNAEINVFLQEIERFTGIAILTTNLKSNLDKALDRRVQHKLTYRKPTLAMKTRLWEKLLPADVERKEKIDFSRLASNFDFTGAQIRLAIENSLMIARANLKKGNNIIITEKLLLEGARMEVFEEEADREDAIREREKLNMYIQ